MAIDSKGNNHQPKGTPNAGKFAPKAGAMDDSDLGVSAGAAPEYVHNRKKGWSYADKDDMAEFRAALPVEPVVMGDRDYGEAAAVRDTKDGYVVDLYSGLYPTTCRLSPPMDTGRGRRPNGRRATRSPRITAC